MEQFILENIKHYWPLLLMIGGFTLAVIVAVRYKLPELTQRIERAEKRLNGVEKAETGFVLEAECKGERTSCRSELCKKIDDVKRETSSIRSDLSSLDRKLIEVGKDIEHLVQAEQQKDVDKMVAALVQKLSPIFMGLQRKEESKNG